MVTRTPKPEHPSAVHAWERIFSNMTEAVVVFNKDGNITAVNEACVRLHGFASAEEMIRYAGELPELFECAYPDGSRFPPQQWPVVRAWHGEVVRECELWVRRKDTGLSFVASYSATPLRENGDIVEVVVNIHDITVQKQTESTLARQKAQIEALFESMAEAAFVVDGQGYVTATNAAYRAMFGSRPDLNSVESYRGQFELRTLSGEIVPHEQWPINRALRGEIVRGEELETYRWDGSVSIIKYNATAVRDCSGSITHVIVTCEDTTERKRAEQELHKIRNILETAQRIVKVGSWDNDLRTGALWWSDETYRIFGITPGTALTTDDFFRFVHPEDRDRVRELAARALRRECDYDLEHRILTLKGEVRDVRQRAKVIVDERGDAIRMIGCVQDITEQKRATAELERVNRIVRLAHETGNSCAWEVNLETGELFWTPECHRLFGVPPLFTPTMENFLSLIHPDDRTVVRTDLTGAMERRESRFRSDYRIIRSDGVRWIERRAHILGEQEGKPARLIGISTDVTERKHLEQELTRSNEDLRQFAYVASHDLQEPLRIIGSYSQLLARRNQDKLDPESHSYIQQIVAGVDRMRRFIRDLLEYSRVTQTDAPPLTLTDCNAVLGLTLQHLQSKMDETRAVVTFDRLPVVKAHEGRLQQVFANLLSNAIKYAKDKPQIHISVRLQGGEWIFSVKDAGIGIEPKYHEAVFGVFKRLHGWGEYPGTGIGLAICKRIVEQHGGRMWVESEGVGKGSTFYFTVPAEIRADEKMPSETLIPPTTG